MTIEPQTEDITDDLDTQSPQGPGGDDSPQRGASQSAMDAAAREAQNMLLDRILKADPPKDDGDASPDAARDDKAADKKPAPAAGAGDKAANKKPAKADDTDPQGAQGAAAAGDDQPPADPKPKRPRVSGEKIAEVASRAAAKAAADAMAELEERRAREAASAAARQPQPPDTNVPPDLKDDADRLREVSRLYPERYSGRDLVRELIESGKREKEYERKWRKEHPGEAFDWSSPDHEEFVASNAVEVDAKHLKDAELSLVKESAIREAEERFAKKYGRDLEEVRRVKEEAKLAPIMRQADFQASSSLVAAVRPDLANAAKSDYAKAVEEVKGDQLAVEIIQEVERWSVPALELAVRVAHNPSAYTEQSREIQALAQVAASLDANLGMVPIDERPSAPDGRTFATWSEYSKMSRAEQREHFTVQDESLLPGLIIHAASTEAATRRQRMEKAAEAYARRMGYVKPASNGSQSATPPADKKTPPPPAPAVKAQPQPPPDGPKPAASGDALPAGFLSRIGIPAT